jgi:hypothetical protein
MFGIHRFGKESPGYKNGNTCESHYCIDCNKEISYTGFMNTKRCNKCHGKVHCGKNNSNFIDGRSHLDYPIDFNKDLKFKIRTRDNFECGFCDKLELKNKTDLSIHHIDYNKKNNKNNNLLSLCKSCHTKTNGTKEFDRSYWFAYCTYIMENR